MRKVTFRIPVTITVNVSEGEAFDNVLANIVVEAFNGDPHTADFDVEDAVINSENAEIVDSR